MCWQNPYDVHALKILLFELALKFLYFPFWISFLFGFLLVVRSQEHLKEFYTFEKAV